MDGLLVVDKPSGPTSHDVVARMRRALREKRIGHTGTLDPMATGVLLLVVGKATRLAKFLSGSDKSYDAVVRLGFATDTADAQGQPLGPVSDRPMPSRDAIDAALDAFRGTFLQQPPAFSAKKIDGQRSYKLARNARLKPSSLDGARNDPERAAGSRYEAVADLSCPPAHPALPAPPALPAAVSVTTHGLEILAIEAETVTLRVHCSAGFYIRSLAHDLGERLGVGAHLSALRRTRSGDFGLDEAIDLEAAERDPAGAVSAMRPLAGMLPRLTAVVLNAEGVNRAVHGRDLGPGDFAPQSLALSPQPYVDLAQAAGDLLCPPLVKLLDRGGELIAIAQPTGLGGLLHPSVVLV
jgi:tRNA pseudouridine55 synthase